MKGFPLENEAAEKYPHRIIAQGLKESDIIEAFIRAQGPGGQKVNKTSSCVYLKHIPTGIEVKCQQARSQAQNRVIGRRLLEEKIRKYSSDKILKEKQKQEKLRRQKRKRTKKEKLRILEEKKKHSLKKKLRVKIREIE